ncbi:MAG: gamma-glutamyltransferase family protein [Alphaproteobacteria bacterium]
MFATRPEIRGTQGVVTSSHWLASMAGWAMFERGGNAFDAAVAAGFALQVVEPHQNGPGGDLPIVLHSGARNRVEIICGQGVAPGAATVRRFRELGLDIIPGTGLLAACVPGAFDAWMVLLREHGTLSLDAVMAPAIGYAREGYAVVPMLHQKIATHAGRLRRDWPGSAEIYLVDGDAPAVGSLHRNRRLADTYERLVREAVAEGGGREDQIEAARRIFYEGFIADAIDRFCRTTEWPDATGGRHGGLLTGDDLAGWRASIEPPVSYDYNGYRIYKPGPWSQGPVLLQQLALLGDFDVAAMDPLGPELVHTQVEAAKLAFADREAWYGDPSEVEVPLEELLSENYNASRRRLIGEEASLDFRPGRPGGRASRLPSYGEGGVWSPEGTAWANGDEPSRAAGGSAAVTAPPAEADTVHVTVADASGNMVSCTPSGGWLQGSPVIPSLGFCLGTRMQMFWLDEGVPSGLRPGARPRTTLSPTLVTRDGEPALAFGSPGGDQQDQWTLTMFLRHLHHGMNLQEACDAPNFHTEHMPSSFYPRRLRTGVLKIERRFGTETISALGRRGHRVEVVDGWSLGRMTVAGMERSRGQVVLKAAATPRWLQAYAVGR